MANSTMDKYTADAFWASRNFRGSARLHLQHILFQNTLGYVLEPRIQKHFSSAKTIRVADLACGNGVWLSDLADELSAQGGVTAELEGFDKNPVNFPAAKFLSSSINLKELDVLANPLPQELIGVYDVVHVRAFSSLIHKGDIGALISTVLSLLKPGGWFQWEETRVDDWQAEAPGAGVSKAFCDSILSLIMAGGKARGDTYDFLSRLEPLIKEQGLVDVEVLHATKKGRDYKAWTEDYLEVWEDLVPYFPTLATAPDAPMSREKYTELFDGAVAETENGVVVHTGSIVTVVARKPGA